MTIGVTQILRSPRVYWWPRKSRGVMMTSPAGRHERCWQSACSCPAQRPDLLSLYPALSRMKWASSTQLRGLNQAFFTLSLGMCNGHLQQLHRQRSTPCWASVHVMVLDSFVAITAGIARPACFTVMTDQRPQLRVNRPLPNIFANGDGPSVATCCSWQLRRSVLAVFGHHLF